MLTVFSEILLVAGAGFYVWMLASQLVTPGLARLQRWLRRGWRAPLIGCAYCSGFYLSILFTLSVQWGRLDPVTTTLSILSAAALIGLAGSFTPGMEHEED